LRGFNLRFWPKAAAIPEVAKKSHVVYGLSSVRAA